MKFERLKINNFLTIGSIDCSLDNKGLVLIQGDNRDDTSQDSNGAGKSSFPDAILWALFGSTARGETGDKVVNRKARKGCLVEVTLSDDDAKYIITRHRKHSVEKNRLTLFQTKDGKTEDLTKGTDKLTQDLVTKVLGCSEEVFCAAIYAGQESMPDLPGMTDKQLKMLVEEAAGIDRLQAAHLISQQRLREAKNNHASENMRLVGINQSIAEANDSLEDLYTREERFKENKEVNVANIKNLAVTCKDSFQKASVEKKEADLKAEALSKAFAEVNDRIKSADTEREREAELGREANQAQRKAASAEQTHSSNLLALQKAMKEAKKLETSIGEPCNSCGKPYTEDDMSEVLRIANEKIEEAKKVAKLSKSIQEVVLKNELNASQELSDFKATMTDLSEEMRTRDDIQAQVNDLHKYANNFDRAKRDLAEVIANLKQAMTATNPITDLIDQAKKKIVAKEQELKDQEEVVSKHEQLLKVAEAAEKVFGQAGVRAHILDSVTPFLNHRTAEYLGTLTDENISATWNTISTTAKGDLREKFVIDVSSKVGAANFRSLSGGEKRKVRLACSMALQDLVSSRASKPIDLYIADEIDHALDDAGLERLMSILDEKAKTKGTALVISHNSLSDWIRKSITIVKEGGQSRLEGAL